jgi:hypothetical protein
LDRGMGPSAETARNFQRPPTPNPDRKSGAFDQTIVAQTGSTNDQLSVETTRYPVAGSRRGWAIGGLGTALAAVLGYLAYSNATGNAAQPADEPSPETATSVDVSVTSLPASTELSPAASAPDVAPLGSASAESSAASVASPPKTRRDKDKPKDAPSPPPKANDDPYGKR